MFLLPKNLTFLHQNFEPNSIQIIYHSEYYSFQWPKLRSADNVTLTQFLLFIKDGGGCSFRKREAAAG